VGKS
jgi:hypothetical protein